MRSIPQEELLTASANDPDLYAWVLADALGHRHSVPRSPARQRLEKSAPPQPNTGGGVADKSSSVEESPNLLMIETLEHPASHSLQPTYTDAIEVAYEGLVSGQPLSPQPSIAERFGKSPLVVRTAAEALAQIEQVEPREVPIFNQTKPLYKSRALRQLT